MTITENCDVIIPHSSPVMKVSPRRDQIISRYPNIWLIGRKDVFQRIMNLGEHFNSEAFDFMPRTFVLPAEL